MATTLTLSHDSSFAPGHTPPKIVGIVNITPDSFSDDGISHPMDAALHRIEQLIMAGADIIDIGAESTRPGATPLTHEEEWQRLSYILPNAIKAFRDSPVYFSIDTRHWQTAQKAIEIGVNWVNDVSGGDSPHMLQVLKSYPHIHVVVMHHLGIPARTDQVLSSKENVIDILLHYFTEKIAFFSQHGIDKQRMILDPGIGFGKTAQQSWQILAHISTFRQLETPILIGHSRKSFFTTVTDLSADKRDIETLAASFYAYLHHVDFVRIHQVAWHKRAFSVFEHLL